MLTKVGQAGDAVGNFITGSLTSVWTIVTFMATSLFLFAQLDLGLVGVVVVWVGARAGASPAISCRACAMPRSISPRRAPK